MPASAVALKPNGVSETIQAKAKPKRRQVAGMSLSSPAQMNVRIDGDLKRAGDAALASVGYSPSQAVRALWSFAAARANDPRALREAMAAIDEEAADGREGDRASEKLLSMQECRQLINSFSEELGAECCLPGKCDDLEAYLDSFREECVLEQLDESDCL